MTPKRLTNFRIDTELLDRLQAIRERDGIPVSEQVRRAISAWLERKEGATSKAARRRVSPRRQA